MVSRYFFFEDLVFGFLRGLAGASLAAMASPLVELRGNVFFVPIETSFGFAGFSLTPERRRRVMAWMYCAASFSVVMRCCGIFSRCWGESFSSTCLKCLT